MPWVSYDSFSVECPDGYLYFPPIVNWGKYYLENNRIMMPVTCGLNHAIADGYLMSNIFVTLAKEIETFTGIIFFLPLILPPKGLEFKSFKDTSFFLCY